MSTTGSIDVAPRVVRAEVDGESTPVAEVAAVAEVAEAVRLRLVDAARADEAAGRAPVAGAAYRERAQRFAAEALDARAAAALRSGAQVLQAQAEARLAEAVLARVCGLGPLEALLAEDGVRNIHITGDQVILDFGDRREARPAITGSDEELVELVRRLAAESAAGERRFDAAAPLLSMELGEGLRLSAVMGVARRVAVAIRRHPRTRLTLGDLQDAGMLDEAARRLLAAAVRARCNIMISGAMGAGKTTLLRALAQVIDPGERLVTIEDAFELALEDERGDVVALQGRPPNIEGRGEVTLAELVRHALRMCPDRVIVGETRGPETLALLNAMNSGTDGSMGTIHASSSADVFAKIATYTAQSPERLALEATSLLIASALHLVVHIDSAPGGERRVASIREVVGAQERQVVSNEIYARTPHGERRDAAPPSPPLAARLAACGYPPQGSGGWGR